MGIWIADYRALRASGESGCSAWLLECSARGGQRSSWVIDRRALSGFVNPSRQAGVRATSCHRLAAAARLFVTDTGRLRCVLRYICLSDARHSNVTAVSVIEKPQRAG